MRIVEKPFADEDRGATHGLVWIGDSAYPLWDAEYDDPSRKAVHPNTINASPKDVEDIKKFWHIIGLTNPRDPDQTCREIAKMDVNELIRIGQSMQFRNIVSDWNLWTPIESENKDELGWAQSNGCNDSMTIYCKNNDPLVLWDRDSPCRVEADISTEPDFMFGYSYDDHDFPYTFVP